MRVATSGVDGSDTPSESTALVRIGPSGRDCGGRYGGAYGMLAQWDMSN